MLNFCFCIPLDLWISYYIPVRLGHETLTNYFSCSGGHGAISIKSAQGHVTPNLCFCIQWDLHSGASGA
jgi:hypothetical protein